MAFENMKKRAGKWLAITVCMIAVICAVLAGCTPAVSDSNETTAPEVTPPATTVPEVTVPDYAGLILGAPQEFTVKLYKNYASSLNAADLVEAEKTEDADGNRYYYYPVQAGKYRYVVSRTGYYTDIKNIYVSETEAANGVLLQVSSGKKAGNGFEPSQVTIYSDAILEQIMPSDKSLWPAYQHAFTSPYFTNTNRAQHQYTTQEEMEAYIAGLDKPKDNMYVFNLGVTDKYKYNIPIVIFTQTDLSSATTLAEAAALVQANNKVTVHYQAQIHGNEPAACEGALAMIGLMQGSYGAELLKDVNLYVIPRLNPDGARDYTRGNGTGDDMNRDLLTAQNKETALMLAVVNMFEPEVFLDGHEFTTNVERTSDAFRDVMISTGWYATNSKEFINLGENTIKQPISTLQSQDMIATYYLDGTNCEYATTGRGYMAHRSILTVLVESRGINSGTVNYERRVAGQVISMQSLLDYVKANHETINTVVNNEKKSIAEKGKTYETTDYIALRNVSKKHTELTISLQYWDSGTGEKTQVKQIVPVSYELPNPARVRPTAYVIPAGETWTAKVLEILDRHGITYDQLPAGSSVYLQQYTGNTTTAQLTAEQKFTFAKGAYAITMDQELGNIIAQLMEPDVKSDSTKYGTLAQEKIIPVSNNTFPIYRYIRDLNAQGQIDLA